MADPDGDRAPSYWLSKVDSTAFPPPATLPSAVDVVVIGAGLMGVSIAFWLSKADVRVLLLESGGLCWGATGRNAGLMLAGTSPLEDPELVRGVLAEERIEAEYDTPGHLALASSQEIWDRICAEAARRKGSTTPIHALDRESCEDLLHLGIAKNFWGGRWFPQGGLIHSTRFVYGLAGAASRRGTRIATRTRVFRVDRRAGREGLVVRTTRGDVRAGHVIYACSTGVVEFVPFLRDVITPVCGQVLSSEPLPLTFKVGLAVDWGTVYWRQAADGTVILGGQPDRGRPREVSRRQVVDPRIQRDLDGCLQEIFPGLPGFKVSQRWAGVMDCSRDGKPLVGRLPDSQDVWVVCGFCGHGMPAGLGVGRAVAEGITYGVTPAVLQPFDPNRFRLPGT